MPDQSSAALCLPESKSTGDSSLPRDRNLVVLGANGSGKSRLGAWIEDESPRQVHRISAQKSLEMPESVRLRPVEEARKRLLFGRDNIEPDEMNPDALASRVLAGRWNQGPVTQTLNDFTQLMEYLLSEHSQRSKKYLKEAENSDDKPPTPTTKLRVVMRVWQEVFPHRKLDETETGRLKTYPPGNAEDDYNAAELSDGERVAFYLIGECMAAPEDGIIVVDEPEIHLHRSIQSDLWDAIEQVRGDCQFVYFTHDLNFASGREAIRVWLKEYDGEEWDWLVIEEQEGIPEEVLLSILGSRRPVLFVEGDKGSLDYRIYDRIYPEHTVMPCGGCEEVISSTQAFEDLRELHDLDCCGLIDRDYRTDEEVEALEDQSVYVTEVSEVENLLITEEVLRVVGQEKHLNEGEGEGVDTRVQRAKGRVFERLEDEKKRLAASIGAHRIRRELRGFGPEQENKESLKEDFEDTTNVDPDAIYQEAKEEVISILEDRDYEEVVKIYDQEGLPYEVAPIFEEGNDYVDYIIRLLASGHDPLESALREHLPSLQGNTRDRSQTTLEEGIQ